MKNYFKSLSCLDLFSPIFFLSFYLSTGSVKHLFFIFWWQLNGLKLWGWLGKKQNKNRMMNGVPWSSFNFLPKEYKIIKNTLIWGQAC